MTADVVTADRNMSYKQAAELLTGQRVNAIPVVAKGGRVVGMVSEADVLGKAERRPWRRGGGLSSRARRDRAKAKALTDGVAALKADPSVRRIALSGSVSVVRQLLAAGLLDELHLFVHPVLAGSGLRLFQDGIPEQPLRLLSCQPFPTEVIYLVYGPDPAPPAGNYERAKEKLPQE